MHATNMSTKRYAISRSDPSGALSTGREDHQQDWRALQRPRCITQFRAAGRRRGVATAQRERPEAPAAPLLKRAEQSRAVLLAGGNTRPPAATMWSCGIARGYQQVPARRRWSAFLAALCVKTWCCLVSH